MRGIVEKKGKKYGNWTIVSKSGSYRKRNRYKCKCSCGNISVILGTMLRKGKSKQCAKCSSEQRRKTVTKFSVEDVKVRNLFSTKRCGARIRKHLFELSIQEFSNLISKDCHYCGKEPSNCLNLHKKYKHEDRQDSILLYQGIDRVDSSLGYVKNNVVPCCIDCNKAKLDKSEKDFDMWIEKVYNHRMNN